MSDLTNNERNEKDNDVFIFRFLNYHNIKHHWQIFEIPMSNKVQRKFTHFCRYIN